MKTVKLKLRLKALLIDYLFIMAYLLVLAMFISSIYWFFFDGIPVFTENQSQWVAFLTTILPVVLYFTIREAKAPYATFGKAKTGLEIKYSVSPLRSSFIRNGLKFLPWHLGHYSAIRGMYTNQFLSKGVFIPYVLTISFPVIYILMVGTRKDHRHLPDILARTYIILSK